MKKGGRNECWVYRRTKIRPTGSRQCVIYDNLEGHDEWLTYPELREIGGLEKRNFYAVIQRMINAGSLEKRPIWLHNIVEKGDSITIDRFTARAATYGCHVVIVIPFDSDLAALQAIEELKGGNIAKLTETDELLVETLAHWVRMIKWVKSQDSDEGAYSDRMEVHIKESWFREDCPLCNRFYELRDCNGCPIATRFGVCSWLNEENLWDSVATSETWGEWLENAKKFREQIASLLED